MLDALRSFFGPVRGATVGEVTAEEEYRSALAGIGLGTLVALAELALDGVPAYAAAIGIIYAALGYAADWGRRHSHGGDDGPLSPA